MLNFIIQILQSIWKYLSADWYILLIGIILAVVISVYVDSNKLKNMLMKKTGISIPGAVAFGALTPLCACGTMAVLLSMFVTAMPWGPVMAFLISSPLSSPSEYMFETAFFGSKFATAVLITSIALGLFAGFLANFLEKRTGFFKDQLRLAPSLSHRCCSSKEKYSDSKKCCDENKKQNNVSCCASDKKMIIKRTYNIKAKSTIISKEACCTNQEELVTSTYDGFVRRYKLDKLAKEFVNIGLKKILFYFILFIAIGRIVEMIIPQSLIMTLFSADKSYSIPLAATIGLPLYLNDSSALPLLKSFINSGAGQGAVLAFIITGKATGVPVIAGMSTFLKKRAMLFYIGCVYFGGILSGYLFQLLIR